MIRSYYPTLLLSLFILVGCSKPIAFEYRNISDIKIETSATGNPQVYLNLTYYNPNNFGVNLKRVNCDISVDNIHIGNFNLDTLMHISKNSEFNLPSRFSVNMNDILKVSAAALFKEVTITAKGMTKVGKGGIFVNIPIEYTGKQKLNLF